MNTSPIKAVAQLVSNLEELARITDHFLAAFESGDVVAVRRWFIASRPVRARIADSTSVLGDLTELHSSESIDMIARLGELTARQRQFDQAYTLWAERSLPSSEILLETRSGIEALTDALLPTTWDYYSDLVVLIGPGLSDVVEELVRQGQRRIAAVIPSGQDCDYGEHVLVLPDREHLYAAIGRMSPGPPRRMVSTRHPDYELDEEVHREIGARAEQAMVDVRVHCNTVGSFAEIWIDQGLANLPAVASSPSVDSLVDTFRGKPMVIVAPGPSLAKNVHRLAELQGKAIIVTFSHTMAALTDAGITPDLVMTVDPQDVRYHFDGTSLDGVAALVNGATVHPALFELPVGRFISAAANTALDDWIYQALGDDATLEAGGSVATSAMAMGLRWGCNPIAFVGLDLSFPHGQYYVESSCDGDTSVAMTDDGEQFVVSGWSADYRKLRQVQGASVTPVQSVIELPGYDGGTVPSSFMFSVFHRWFEDTVARCADTTRVINCTEGGARIEGTEQMGLEALIALLPDCGLNVGESIEAAVAELDIEARKNRMADRAASMLEGAERCVALAHRCESLAGRVLANQSDQSAMKALAKAESLLQRALQPVLFISSLRQREIGEAQRRAHAAVSVAETLDASAALFSTLRRSAQALLEPMRTAHQRLRAL